MVKGVHTNKSRGGGQNLNCKFKTFGFLDTLKVHIQSNYLANTTLSLLQTKLAGKNSELIFFPLHFSVLDLKSVIDLSSRGVGVPPLPLPPVYHLAYIFLESHVNLKNASTA